MGKKSAPTPPDPAATAAAQSAANKDTAVAQARLNATNQITPYGNLTYTAGPEVGGVPQYTATQTLSPEQQALYEGSTRIGQQGINTAENLFGQLQGTLGTAAPQYDENYRQQQLNAMLLRQQPQLDQQRQSLEQSLANQGITVGSQAYNDAIGNYDRSVNDLRLAADTQAGNEARAAYQTTLGGRSAGINEITGLLGLGQVQNPSFVNTPQTGIANTDVIGPTQLAYQGQLANWQNSQANQRALMGAVTSLGGAALGGWAYGGFKT